MPDIDIQLDTNLYTGSENAIDEMSPVKATTEESEKTLTEKVRRIFVKGNKEEPPNNRFNLTQRSSVSQVKQMLCGRFSGIPRKRTMPITH